MGYIHEDLKRAVAEKDAEYRKLVTEHAHCESRLQELQGKAFLDESEKLETVNVKKQKLQIKDRMEAILRQYAERAAGAGVER